MARRTSRCCDKLSTSLDNVLVCYVDRFDASLRVRCRRNERREIDRQRTTFVRAQLERWHHVIDIETFRIGEPIEEPFSRTLLANRRKIAAAVRAVISQ